MQNMLIIGADSTIGAHLKKHCKSHFHTIYGTSRHADRCIKTTFFLDLLNPDAFHIPDQITIDTIVFCATMSTIKACEENKALSYQINVESMLKLTRYLKNRFNPFMIFLSSNVVFDGTKPFRLETEPTCPVNYYGQCKAEAEEKISSITDKLAILRMTKVLHPDHPLIKKWINDLKNKANIYPFSDLMLAPISLETASDAIKKIATLKKNGIFHLSGNQDITYVELAINLAKKIKSDAQLIIPSTFKNFRRKTPEISDGKENGYFSKGSPDLMLKHEDCASPPIQYQPISFYNSLDMTYSKKYLKISETDSNTIIDNIFQACPI